jgi:hypothetical protein
MLVRYLRLSDRFVGSFSPEEGVPTSAECQNIYLKITGKGGILIYGQEKGSYL